MNAIAGGRPSAASCVPASAASLAALAQGHGAPVAELHHRWLSHTSGRPGGTGLFLENGVHPGDTDHILMAEWLLALLR